MDWSDEYGGRGGGRGRGPYIPSPEDVRVQEALLRNIHISEGNDGVISSQGQSEEMMGITMQDREAAEVLLQMGGMARFGGSGPPRPRPPPDVVILDASAATAAGPQRKSVITDTRSALQQDMSRGRGRDHDTTPRMLSTSVVAPVSLKSVPVSSIPRKNPSFSISSPQGLSSLTTGGSGSGGIVFLPQKLPPRQSDPQVPISVVQRTETLSRGAQFLSVLRASEPQVLGPPPPIGPQTQTSTQPGPQLLVPLGSSARLEQQVQSLIPELSPSPSSSSSSKNSSTQISQSQRQRPNIGQLLPQLQSSPTVTAPPTPRTTSLLLPVAGVNGAFIHLSPSSALASPSAQITQITTSSLPIPLITSTPQPPSSSASSKPSNALNLGHSHSLLSSKKATISPILIPPQSQSQASSYTTLSFNLGRNLVTSNSNNSSNFINNSSSSTSTLSSSSSLSNNLHQSLRKKREAKAEKKALRARVPLNKDASKDIEVDGFIIPREFWAKAFVQTDICHAAGILFKALFSVEEIQKCTLRGRNGTCLLNLQKRSAIFRAVGWMKEKDQNPYSFDSSAVLYHTHTLTHEEKMIIEKKVFVERRYQTSRKIRDHHHPRGKRANKNIVAQQLLQQQQQKEAILLLGNPTGGIGGGSGIPTSSEMSQGAYPGHNQSKVDVEDILIKPEPLDVDVDPEYYEGQGDCNPHPPQPPIFIKKETFDPDPDLHSNSKPSSPKQPKLQDDATK